MAYKTPIQTLKNEQEYYDGMKRALIVDPTLLQMYNIDDEDIDFMHIQSQIFETPSSQQLTSLFNDEYSSILLYVFLYIPISQVISYARNNLINYIDSEAIPPSYCIDEPEELIFELKNITQLGRERIFNHYTWEKSQEIQLLKKAIIELDSDSMKLIMKSEKIDILWLRKILGYYHYINLTREGMSLGRLSEDETSLIFSRLFDEFPIYDESEPYLYDWYEKTKKINSLEVSEKTYDPEVEQIANDVISLFLKMYWSDYSEYRKQTRQIIDSYINKPCFKDFVSKCRAEFEEEERQRAEKTTEGEIVDTDTEPVVEEVQKQAPQDNHINKKEKYNDNASDVAANTKRIHYSVKGLSNKGAASRGNNFQWSDSLKKWYEEHTGKFEDFVRYVAKDKGYIPNEQKQVNAFIRTITGRDVPNCDEKVRLLNNGRDDATRAMLYLKKCKIICSGDYCDIFTYFDVDRPERYREKPDDNSWMSGYARDADNDFKITVIETFNDFSGLKVPKEEQDLNIAHKKE